MSDVPIKLRRVESHIVLYSKGWYKKSNTLDDLKTIFSHLFAIPKDRVTIRDICEYLMEAVLPLTEIDAQLRINFIREIPRWWHYRETTPLSVEEFIEKVLSFIGIIPVRANGQLLVDISEPDYNILPKP